MFTCYSCTEDGCENPQEISCAPEIDTCYILYNIYTMHVTEKDCFTKAITPKCTGEFDRCHKCQGTDLCNIQVPTQPSIQCYKCESIDQCKEMSRFAEVKCYNTKECLTSYNKDESGEYAITWKGCSNAQDDSDFCEGTEELSEKLCDRCTGPLCNTYIGKPNLENRSIKCYKCVGDQCLKVIKITCPLGQSQCLSMEGMLDDVKYVYEGCATDQAKKDCMKILNNKGTCDFCSTDYCNNVAGRTVDNTLGKERILQRSVARRPHGSDARGASSLTIPKLVLYIICFAILCFTF